MNLQKMAILQNIALRKSRRSSFRHLRCHLQECLTSRSTTLCQLRFHHTNCHICLNLQRRLRRCTSPLRLCTHTPLCRGMPVSTHSENPITLASTFASYWSPNRDCCLSPRRLSARYCNNPKLCRRHLFVTSARVQTPRTPRGWSRGGFATFAAARRKSARSLYVAVGSRATFSAPLA